MHSVLTLTLSGGGGAGPLDGREAAVRVLVDVSANRKLVELVVHFIACCVTGKTVGHVTDSGLSVVKYCYELSFKSSDGARLTFVKYDSLAAIIFL